MMIGGFYLEHPISYGLIGAFVMIFIAGLNDVGMTYRWMLSTYNIKHRREWYRLLSSGFVHGGWMHLLLNVLGIYFFGTLVEYLAGGIITLSVFIASVLGGGLYAWFIRRSDTDYQGPSPPPTLSASHDPTSAFDPPRQRPALAPSSL